MTEATTRHAEHVGGGYLDGILQCIQRSIQQHERLRPLLCHCLCHVRW
jgi:hypothetical protein